MGAYERSAPSARYNAPVYRFWHHHARILIDQARLDLDAHQLAHLLLAPLTADLQTHLAAAGLDLNQWTRAVIDLIDAVLVAPP